MKAQTIIFNKLEIFIKKYYTNKIIKGSLLFIGFGLLYFIFTLLVEHFLWLSTAGRTFLFWLFILVEVMLLVTFILLPMLKLFKLQKGINYENASKIIGNHFCEVDDKLLNFLQLANNKKQSELLLASIEQKSKLLQPIPFTNAIDFSKNKKYIPYVLVPVIVFLLFFVTGNSSVIEKSFTRVVDYKTHYTPPAPFTFLLQNKTLQVQEGENFILKVSTKGNVIPENVKIVYNNQTYYLENLLGGNFSYTFKNVAAPISFSLIGNEVQSSLYTLNVVEVPSIANLEMELNYPFYTGKKSEKIVGLGNAIVPEGTVVSWNLNTKHTKKVAFVTDTTSYFSLLSTDTFKYVKTIKNTLNYTIKTSNKAIANFESLNYTISVVKDEYPHITVTTLPDSLQVDKNIVIGNISDDYGLRKLQVICYTKEDKTDKQLHTLPCAKDLVDKFVYNFPEGFTLKEGVAYNYYFEVFDNDAFNGSKSSKSAVFSHYNLTELEAKNENLQNQQENINSLEKAIENQEEQLSKLNKIQKINKEKLHLNFTDKKKITSFLKQQQQQEKMMQSFAKKLKKNLEEFSTENKLNKKELERRLNEYEKEAQKNEKLLKELEKLSDKFKKEELFNKSEKLKTNAQSQKMNLEQLVELTKRFYVEEKTKQLAEKLEKLAEKQEKLANDKENNTTDNQSKINKEFKQLTDELQQLEKDNKALESPIEIPLNKQKEQEIQTDLNTAKEKLDKNKTEKAREKQKSAAKKMKEMGANMKGAMQAGQMMQMEEDAKMLRQILDNLLAFSFAEEDLLEITEDAETSSLALNKILKEQQSLKVQFKHIDDSLFVIAQRNPMISEIVFKEITEAHYHLDKTLETLADGGIYKGTSHQQYVLKSANTLADFLSNVQSDMNMIMQGSGEGKPQPGKGQGMQLPDIIKKQEELGKQMQKDGKQGKQGEQGENEGKEKGNKKGEQGKQGMQGEQGESGEGDAGKILRILQQQQQLRNALQNALEKEKQSHLGNDVLQKMKDLEKELINKGFKNATIEKMLQVKHELLKLEKAIQEQGQDSKRKSKVNTKKYTRSINELSPQVKEYLNSIEILNRQPLPLQPDYNKRVKQYFKNNDYD